MEVWGYAGRGAGLGSEFWRPGLGSGFFGVFAFAFWGFGVEVGICFGGCEVVVGTLGAVLGGV